MRTTLHALSLLALVSLPACSSGPTDESAEPAGTTGAPSMSEPARLQEEPPMADEATAMVEGEAGVGRIELSDTEWRELLTDEQYHILRKKGTERAGTGHLLKSKTEGTYVCAGCGLALFASGTKFDSGTGWPSFYAPIKDGHVAEESDKSHGWSRTEVLCARCDGHLGHVFPDGPKPTGLRYCINSASLELEPAKQ